MQPTVAIIRAIRGKEIGLFVLWKLALHKSVGSERDIMLSRRGENANPPIQVPKIAGAPANITNQKNTPRLGELAFSPLAEVLPGNIGAAMPMPSVILWSVKPTTRKEPRAASPRAKAAPIASPSPKLCKPIPMAIKVAI